MKKGILFLVAFAGVGYAFTLINDISNSIDDSNNAATLAFATPAADFTSDVNSTDPANPTNPTENNTPDKGVASSGD